MIGVEVPLDAFRQRLLTRNKVEDTCTKSNFLYIDNNNDNNKFLQKLQQYEHKIDTYNKEDCFLLTTRIDRQQIERRRNS